MSRFNRMRKKMKESQEAPKLPVQKSDHCLGECDVQIFGKDSETGRPIVCCNGCGRNLSR